MSASSKPARLRQALAAGMVTAPFTFDALQAKQAEAAGFAAVYMTGFGTAAARGLPDLGLIGLADMVANVRSIASAVSVPVVCDADTGYGSALSVQRTVREYEAAGAAGLHLEDQVSPKRCGFLAGKEVVPLDEILAKLRAALDAREDRSFVVIGRTDALEPHGWDEVERRARAFAETGVDLVFVDGIHTERNLDTYQERLGDLPLVYNGALLPVSEIEKRGFALMLHIGTLISAYAAMRDTLRELAVTGSIEAARDPSLFKELVELLGVQQALERARKYE